MGLFNRYSLFIFKIAALIGYLALCYWAYQNRFVLPVYVDVVFFLLFIDRENILSLRNYFVVYGFLIFKVSASYFFPEKYDLPFDGSLYLSAFLLGYELKKIFSKHVPVPPQVDKEVVEQDIKKVLWLLKVFIGMKLLYLVFLIAYHGFTPFYSGQVLAEKAQQYGRKSVLDAVLIIYTNFVDSFIAAAIVIYIRFVSALKQKPNYYYLAFPLLIIPLLLVSRSTFAFGIMTMLAIYSYFARSSFRTYVYLVPVLIALSVVAIYIGKLRMDSYTSGEDFSDVTTAQHFVTELTPIIAYKVVKENIRILKFQNGKTIVLPLVTKVIPRGIWQAKPDNSTAYFAKEFDPGSFYSGFMMPLTLFGDLYLNFGIAITCFLLFFVGMYIARFDQIYTLREFKHIDDYFILFICFYNLVRNNIPESVIYVLLIYVAKKIIEMFILKNKPIR